MNENFDLALKDYIVVNFSGLTNIIELLQGKDKLLSAQQNLLQSKYMTLLNQQMLRFYAGDGK